MSDPAVLFRQRLLRAAGLYLGLLDGIAGPQTAAAEQEWQAAHDAVEAALPSSWGGQTGPLLRTLVPKAHRAARGCLMALTAALAPEHEVRVTSGTRTYPEQDALFAQGRTVPPIGKRYEVTHARGGQSWHNFGLAWDVSLFTPSGEYLADDPLYDRFGAIWCPTGIVWGGDWPEDRRDRPHFELDLELSLLALRVGFESGTLHVD